MSESPILFINPDYALTLAGAAIIEEHVTMDDDVVSKREVIAVRPFDEMPALKILADFAKDERRKHPTETMAEMRVLTDGRAVIHLPEPDEGLAFGVGRAVNVRVILRL